MKHRASAVVVCCVSMLVLAACGSSKPSSTTPSSSAHTTASVAFTSIEESVPSSYPQPKPDKLRLAYLNPSAGNTFLSTIGESMRLATQKLGGTYIELATPGSVDTQVSQFNQLIAEGVNGIAVFALDPKSLAPDIARAKAAGIHLITIDLNFTNTSLSGLEGYESQVWQGRDRAGYLTAKYMAGHLPAGSTVGTIEFGVKVPSIVYSLERDVYWAKKFGIKVSGTGTNATDEIAGGEKAMTELLGKNANIKGVMAYNDPSAIGAYAAARSAGVTGLVLGGQNGGSEALAAIKTGRETFTARLNAPSVGKDWAWGLYDLSEHTKVPPTIKALPAELIDSENVSKARTWPELLKQEYPGS